MAALVKARAAIFNIMKQNLPIAKRMAKVERVPSCARRFAAVRGGTWWRLGHDSNRSASNHADVVGPSGRRSLCALALG